MGSRRATWLIVLGPAVGLHCQAFLTFDGDPDASSEAGGLADAASDGAAVDDGANVRPIVDAANPAPFCVGIDGSCEDFDPPPAGADAGCNPYGGGVGSTRVEAFDGAPSPPNVLVSTLQPSAPFDAITGCDFKFFGRKRLVASFHMQSDLPANAKAFLGLVRYLGPGGVAVDVHLFRRETGALSLALDIGASIHQFSAPERSRPIGNWARYTIDVDAETRIAHLRIDGLVVSSRDYSGAVGPATSVDFVFAPELSYMVSTSDAGVSAQFDNVVIDTP